MLKKILLGIVAIIAILVAVIYMQPSEFSVERSATFAASDSVVYAQINDFRNWEAWSPWAKLDPNMTVTYDGPVFGTGSQYMWNGNEDVGSGKMMIIGSIPHEYIEIQLDFYEPFASSNTTIFTISGDSTQSTVTWNMSGQNNFISKAFGLFVNMDEMIGADFEKGLASLKEVVE
jgi:hypothetical protein